MTDVLVHPESGTGFKFYKYEQNAFLETISSALELLKNARKWVEIQKQGQDWYPMLDVFNRESRNINPFKYSFKEIIV